MTRRNHRISATLLLLLLSPISLVAQTALQRVRQTGELRVGTDATYPPFETAEGGQFTGFDIDLANAVARELGVRAAFTNSGFDGIFPALQNGTFDIVISAVTITPERSATMLFSDPYINAGQLIAIHKETGGIEKPEDLKGKHIGVQINTTAQFDFEKREGVEVTKYDSVALALTDLRNKRIDAVVSDAPVLRYMILQSFQDLKPVGRQFTDEKLGIVLARDSDELRRAVNAALWRVKDSGEYDRIHQKWFGEAAEQAAGSSATQPKAFDLSIVQRTWRFFLTGIWLTARLAFLSLLLGLPIGLLLALARVQSSRILSAPAAVYVEVIRGTPLLVQILFIYFVLPSFGIFIPAFWSGVLALTLNSAAYIAEIFRAGILSIDAGQMEAARALGMTHAQAMRRIILPQTFRRVVPPLTNEAIALLKDSSLVYVIGLSELTRTGQELASRYAAPLTIWPMVAIFYLLLTFPLTRIAEYLERRWRPITRS
ncbi:MAG: arginine/lysine/histidine/glutamine transport system substrate-binding and permease protein [Acidobacteriota bacterium]|jgi:His/Glu/Gln/Arg/opine family amino acid ABC transporter permease subunit|nr:arginine/lysine/histidine/glutamine transport system substrate-binding and permease protein [Acidobacteriota bacterium]